MRNSNLVLRFIFWRLTLGAVACTDKTESLSLIPISDYAPLTVGKYITYRVDSMVFTNFGRTTEIHKYQMKHVIDAQFNDGMCDPAGRLVVGTDIQAGGPPNGVLLSITGARRTEVLLDGVHESDEIGRAHV